MGVVLRSTFHGPSIDYEVETTGGTVTVTESGKDSREALAEGTHVNGDHRRGPGVPAQPGMTQVRAGRPSALPAGRHHWRVPRTRTFNPPARLGDDLFMAPTTSGPGASAANVV
ncbi:hypothetical protein [Micromonospora zamorensis]|uniref:hypothetical protein n=1 Tax=Micromonospora zamorensis TaxID=709883 RepID=UPI00081FD3E9|nr:hypothetical protein [Micromonospora zamorensis]SCG57300.1 hypothetical protein GA0070619_3602 [Micromonospora zamorensis]